MVVGNSELRIEFNHQILHSNFGARLKFFDSKNDSIKDFLGIEQRDNLGIVSM